MLASILLSYLLMDGKQFSKYGGCRGSGGLALTQIVTFCRC